MLSKKLVLISLNLLATCLILSCDPVDSRLTVENQSPNHIYFIYQTDSVLKMSENFSFAHPSYYIPARDSINVTRIGHNTWEMDIKESPTSIVYFFFFSADSLKKYSSSEIIDNQKYLGRIPFSEEEIKQKRWNLIWTGAH